LKYWGCSETALTGAPENFSACRTVLHDEFNGSLWSLCVREEKKRVSARLSVRPMWNCDRDIYKRVLPKQSLLLDVLNVITWPQFQLKLEKYCSPSNDGQPECPPVILLKLELLCHLYGIGREKAIERPLTGTGSVWNCPRKVDSRPILTER